MADAEATDEEAGNDDPLAERREEVLERVEAYFGEHRDDLERRHWVQALGTVGLLGSGTRELYRRELLDAFPSARYQRNAEEPRWAMSWEPNRETLPETLSGASGFAVLVALAAIGSERRAEEQPLLSVLTAGASLFQAAGSVRRLAEDLERGDIDALASIETILSASTVPLVLPEAVRAVRKWIGQ